MCDQADNSHRPGRSFGNCFRTGEAYPFGNQLAEYDGKIGNDDNHDSGSDSIAIGLNGRPLGQIGGQVIGDLFS